MKVTRRDFGRLAASSTIVIALPMGRLLADAATVRPAGETLDAPEHVLAPEITVESAEKGKMKAKGKTHPHHKKAVTKEYLSDGFDKIGWGKDSEKDPSGWTPLPRDGTMSVLIDFKGNWEFSGGFPPQKMYYPCATAVGLGLKSSVGKVLAFIEHGTVPESGEGWQFSKQGHSPIVADLWKDVVKGHEFHGNWSTHQITPKPAGGGGGGGSDASQVVSDVTTGLGILGTILAIL